MSDHRIISLTLLWKKRLAVFLFGSTFWIFSLTMTFGMYVCVLGKGCSMQLSKDGPFTAFIPLLKTPLTVGRLSVLNLYTSNWKKRHIKSLLFRQFTISLTKGIQYRLYTNTNTKWTFLWPVKIYYCWYTYPGKSESQLHELKYSVLSYSYTRKGNQRQGHLLPKKRAVKVTKNRPNTRAAKEPAHGSGGVIYKGVCQFLSNLFLMCKNPQLPLMLVTFVSENHVVFRGMLFYCSLIIISNL